MTEPIDCRPPLEAIDAFLSAYSPEVQAMARRARALVLELVPDALEQIDEPARLLGYGYTATYRDTICVVMPLKAAVNLGLPRGADLPDPAGLLEGSGKRARHVKLRTLDAVDRPELRELVLASAAQVRPTN